MADARMRSPLDGRAEDLAALGAREVPFLAQVSLRLAGEDDLGLPRTPNAWTASDGRELLWLGPDEWLVVGEPGTAESLVAWLEGALADAHRAVVDVSSNRVAIELEGDRRFELLEQGCGLDLHPRSWRAGMCAQTLLARVPVLLQERGDATRVFVRPSFADWLVDWFVAVGT